MKQLRTASEAEVIAEFLKGEYHQKEYHVDRQRYEAVVMNPNLSDASQNAARRQLLYRRHRVTWKELPEDTRWFLVQLGPDDLDRIRVFPRGHWPKIALNSSFAIADVVSSIKQRCFAAEASDDVTAIHAIAYRLKQQADNSSVLLIGVDEAQPLTILEGNHRMIAAALSSTDIVASFNFYAGFSPAMTECFWYHTTTENMFRHVYRRLRDLQPNLLLRELKQRWAA
jgi:hypothetical protein